MTGAALDIPWPQTISTERLDMRPPGRADRRALIGLITNPDVRRHLGGPIPRWKAEMGVRAVNTRVPGTFVIAEGPTRICVGLVHLDRHRPARPGHRTDPDVPETSEGELELSYSLAPSQWRHGYAHEATAAALEWIAPLVPDRHVIAVTQRANARSVALLDRLGFVERERFVEFGEEQTLRWLPLVD